MNNSKQEYPDVPEWMTEAGLQTLSKGYLLEDETVVAMYRRIARSAAKYGNYSDDLKHDFFDVMYKYNFLCPASPILSNLGTDRGLSISCFGLDVADNMQDIMSRGVGELAALTKAGGGVGVGMDNLRPRGSLIKGGKNGRTEGIVPFAKVYDSAIMSTKQGTTRRGAASINLNIEHGDWEEFIRMRKPEGDVNRQCPNIHHCTMISDEFMNKVISGDHLSRVKWVELMRTRQETGESYIMYLDNVNKANPIAYQKNGLEVNMTNICSEITLYTDELHSFICCLSSLNLARYDEWKDWKSERTGLTLPRIATYFLDAVLEEFIVKAKYLPGLDRAVRSAEKGRAIGIGVLGWHTYLQENGIPFESFQAMTKNNEIFKFIDEESKKASKELAKSHGEPEWCKGTGMRNSHLTAVAPTRSNSIISGDVSPGIEPIIANAYVDTTAKGTFIRKNPTLANLLEGKNKNTKEIWKSISSNYGSVQHLDFLSEDEKKVFKTAYEINQNSIVQQASQRQKYICQAQSLNLFFGQDVDPKHFNDVHINAWKLGVKTLYYVRSQAGIKVGSTDDGNCASCEG